MLVHSSSAVVSSTVAATALASERRRQDLVPSSELCELIEAHMRDYVNSRYADDRRAIAYVARNIRRRCRKQ
ncbi:hypothetical protein BQ8794_240037 [Mesorhizobium prunaredense]|uniref:Uncharacterized protein n=1 Tax=Mesorhizobium prunaredense TaxID=1631249 RepID=A0A1R3V987_9HYPH|nr:hypothetical protein BQ8794_240037 [Mesorhizobium prunaredense]